MIWWSMAIREAIERGLLLVILSELSLCHQFLSQSLLEWMFAAPKSPLLEYSSADQWLHFQKKLTRNVNLYWRKRGVIVFIYTCRSCRNNIFSWILEMWHDHSAIISVFGVEFFNGHRNASFVHLSLNCLKIKNNSDVNLCIETAQWRNARGHIQKHKQQIKEWFLHWKFGKVLRI